MINDEFIFELGKRMVGVNTNVVLEFDSHGKIQSTGQGSEQEFTRLYPMIKEGLIEFDEQTYAKKARAYNALAESLGVDFTDLFPSPVPTIDQDLINYFNAEDGL